MSEKSIVCWLDDAGAEVRATSDVRRLFHRAGAGMFPVSVYETEDRAMFVSVTALGALPRRVSTERAALLFGRLPVRGRDLMLMGAHISTLEPGLRRRLALRWKRAVAAAAWPVRQPPISQAVPTKYETDCAAGCARGTVAVGEMVRYYAGQVGHAGCMWDMRVRDGREADVDDDDDWLSVARERVAG